MRDTGFYDAMAARSAQRHGVPVSWIKAFIGQESSFEIPAPRRWETKVREYAYGPMQILLSTANDLYPGITAEELELPDTNVDVGAAYIRQLRDRYGTDFRDIYSAYNSGSPLNWKNPSSQVAKNVAAAQTWLAQFENVAAGETLKAGFDAGTIAAGAVLALIVFLVRRKGA